MFNFLRYRLSLKIIWIVDDLGHQGRGKVLTAALFASINYPLTLFALQMTHMSYVSGFRQIGVVLALILGAVHIKLK